MDKLVFESYVKKMSDIRALSTPKLEKFDSSEEYSERLRENFQKIGILAGENRGILDEYVFPLVDSEEELPNEIVEMVKGFNDELVNALTVENLDIAIMSLLSERLMRDAEKKQDESYMIRQLDEQILAGNLFVYMTSRVISNQEISIRFREKSLRAALKVREYAAPDKFLQLSDEVKGIVLTNVRYYSTLYGSVAGISAETVHEWILALDEAVAIYENPFYRENFSSFDWGYYLFRTLEHYSVILDYLFHTKPYKEDIEHIVACLRRQEELWNSDPEKYAKYAEHDFLLLSLYHGLYLNEEMSTEEYRAKLLQIYYRRDRQAYDFDNIYINIKASFNYIMTMNPQRLDEEKKALLKKFYRDIIGYAFRMPNGGTLDELLEYYTPVLIYFIEVPGDISFEEMCLRSLAAFHPPTYVHSMTVAHISRCLCEHLLEMRPELFIGVCGCKNTDEVKAGRSRIVHYAYHAALCHDFGKLPIIDTILIYGRKLLDFEFDIIKQHPDLGRELMEQFESTRAYADVARGHHKWYDNSKGYPAEFDTSKSPVKTIIDIVACADCMDAATDSIGRSYNRGKTLDDFEKELREGSGTRYAPFLVELFDQESVKQDIQYLLSEGRQHNYRNTYLLLREIQEREEQK